MSRAAREVASGPYAGHPGDQRPLADHAKYSKELKDGRGVSEWGAAKLCAPLLLETADKKPGGFAEEQLSAFGACIAGALERHPRHGEAVGKCTLGLAREIEKAQAVELST